MKISKETTHAFEFGMKDGKKVHSFKGVVANTEKEARAILTAQLGECLDQLEEADRREAIAEEEAAKKSTKKEV